MKHAVYCNTRSRNTVAKAAVFGAENMPERMFEDTAYRHHRTVCKDVVSRRPLHFRRTASAR
ncbi:MAG: hypothetical protein IJV72_00585 [Clostridia bacterium]|nr:hypothetical protein [Clostridia bacterium]